MDPKKQNQAQAF